MAAKHPAFLVSVSGRSGCTPWPNSSRLSPCESTLTADARPHEPGPRVASWAAL